MFSFAYVALTLAAAEERPKIAFLPRVSKEAR